MASAKKYPLYKYVLAAIDTSTIAAAYIIALVLEQRWLNDHNHLHFLNVLYMAEAAYIVAIAALCVFIFHYLGLYQIHVFVTLAGHLSQIVKGLIPEMALHSSGSSDPFCCMPCFSKE